MARRTIFEQLNPIFHPKSVAIIGASGKPGKIGKVIMDRFLETGFTKIYPVNNREREILGLRTYQSILDIPYPVDMALVLTPTDSALSVVKECAERGVRAIVITTAGFAEAGEEGKELQDEMVRIARSRGARIIGPNCIGIYCPASKLPFTLGPGSKEVGSVGVVSQSGFFADYLTLAATANGVAFSKAISCGNEADLTITDFLEYLGEDPETEMIVCYIEGTKDGRRFYNLSKEISKKKPIILWKGGMTEAGSRAAISHTGSLAGSRCVWKGAMRQAGIISVRSFEETLDCLYAFHLQPIPKGKRVGIISSPGSMAVITTDILVELGLKVPEFSQQTIERLRKAMPAVGGSINNPIDLSMSSMVNPYLYGDAIRILSDDENIDMLLVIAIVGGEVLREIIMKETADARIRKPLVIATMTGTIQSVARDLPLFLRSGIPVYSDPIRAARTLYRLSEYARFRQRWSDVKGETSIMGSGGMKISRRQMDVVERALSENRKALSEHESSEILQAYDITTAREIETYDKSGFREALSEIGFPLVIKASIHNVSHKTEQGFVHLFIRNEQEAMAAFAQILNRCRDRGATTVLVQEMVTGSRELMIGFIRDKQFGPCVLFGLGGIFTEALRDYVFRVAPIHKQEALDMISEIKAQDLLGVFRGMPAVDIDQVAEMLVKVAAIGLAQPEIKEIDINPVIISGSQPVAVDALVVLER